jgi:hypothetical protein
VKSTELISLLAALLLAAPAMAQDEYCNGLDDDDDEQIDENPVDCEPPLVCLHGVCLEPCAETEPECPEGFVCDFYGDVGLCVPDVCSEDSAAPLDCVDNPYCCDEGFAAPCYCEAIIEMCINPCYAVTCPEGLVCVPEDGGACHPFDESCYVSGCPIGEICVDEICVPDPCEGVTCGDGEFCNADGECAAVCTVEDDCPRGAACYMGECVDDACANVVCAPGWTCEDGVCIKGECWNVPCWFYEICVDGVCVDDPCWNVHCPNCALCVNGACYEFGAESHGEADADADGDGDGDGDGDSDGDADGDADADTDDALGDPSSSTNPGSKSCGCAAPGQARARPGLSSMIVGALWSRR